MFSIKSKIFDVSDKLRKGHIVACNTDTVYGLLANSNNPLALLKLYSLKKRDLNKKFVLLINNNDNLHKYVKYIPPYIEDFKKYFNTGKVTCIFKSSCRYKKFGETIAIRIPQVLFLQLLIQISNFDIVCTSANISGNPNLNNKRDIINTFGRDIYFWDFYLKHHIGKHSTIIDCTRMERYNIIRQGCVKI